MIVAGDQQYLYYWHMHNKVLFSHSCNLFQ